MSEPAPTSAALDDYRVELDAYHGPLDLLLYLVKRHEIDLNDIPVAELTEQYLKHLALMKEIDVDVAGEFLVMAATLLEIKSQMLLPLIKAEDEGEDEQAQDESLTAQNPADPRYELVQQLLAYKRFKDAAMNLDQRREQWQKRFAHQPGKADKAGASREGDAADDIDSEAEAPPVEIDLEDANILDLCRAFARLMESIGSTPTHDVLYDDTPIALHQEDILDRLTRDGAMTLQTIFEGRTSRGEMIGLFMAMLELVKLRRVRVAQERIAGEISLELWPEDDPPPDETTAVDWRNPETGEVEYDWPSEKAKQAAERRSRLRASRLERLREQKSGDEADQADDALDDELDEDEMLDLDDDLEDALEQGLDSDEDKDEAGNGPGQSS